MQNTIAHIIRTIAITVAIFVAVFIVYSLGNSYVKVQQQRIASEAIDGCGEMSSYTFADSETGVTTKEPTEKTFLRCLELKGLDK